MNHQVGARSVPVHGPAMRAVREEARLPLSRLAAAAGVSVSFLAQIERGTKRRARPEVVAAVLAELGIADPRALQLDPYGPPVAHSGPTVVPCSISSTRAA